MRDLASELLDASSERRTRSAANKNKRNPPKKAKHTDTNNQKKLLSDSFLRLDNDIKASNSDETLSEKDVLGSFRESISEIRGSINTINDKLNKMLSMMDRFFNKIESLESHVVEQESQIQEQERELQALRNQCEQNDRIASLNKVIMNYAHINTESNNYRTTVKNILRKACKLSPGIVDQISINKFGQSRTSFTRIALCIDQDFSF